MSVYSDAAIDDAVHVEIEVVDFWDGLLIDDLFDHGVSSG